jgi:small GTP-binding protein
MYNLYDHCKHAGEQELNFAIVGLPNGGKTTIKKVLNGDNAPMVVPTIGATKPIEIKEGKDLVTIFDLGGNTQKLWLRYYHKVHGIIWVVDAADSRSLNQSKVALRDALLDERLSGKPVLVFANKQDLPGALDEVNIAQGLGLDALTSSSSKVLKCTALPEKNGGTKDKNLKEGINWLRTKAVSKELKIRVVTDTKNYETKLAQENIETEIRVKEAKEKRRLAKEAKDAAIANGEASAPKVKKPKTVLKCAVVHPVKIWHFKSETSDEKGLALCRTFNEDFSGTVAYQCTEAAACKCSKYKWKPVCEACDEWVRNGFPELTEDGPVKNEDENKEDSTSYDNTAIDTAVPSEKKEVEVVAQPEEPRGKEISQDGVPNDENNNASNTGNPLSEAVDLVSI